MTTPEGETEFDLSNLPIPEKRYRAEELLLSSFTLKNGKVYAIFIPDMMLTENLQFYIVELNVKNKSIEQVTAFDAPKNSSPANPPIADDVVSVEDLGIYVFGPQSVYRVDPETAQVTEVFTEKYIDDQKGPHDVYVLSVGYYKGILLVKWEDEQYLHHISAIQDDRVLATLDLGKANPYLPNIVRAE